MPERPYIFTLTREAAAVMDELALERGNNWRKRNVPSHKIDVARTDYEIDRIGCYGEYAVCALLGIPFNWRTDRADNGIDGTLWGKTVQIKTTETPKRLMVFQHDDHFKTDVAILALVTLDIRTVQIAGWIGRKDYPKVRERGVIAADKVERPFVPMEKLRPISTLFPLLHPGGVEELEDPLELIP
jgi:hypothetical protein